MAVGFCGCELKPVADNSSLYKITASTDLSETVSSEKSSDKSETSINSSSASSGESSLHTASFKAHESSASTHNSAASKKASTVSSAIAKQDSKPHINNGEMRAIWCSYIELNFAGMSYGEFKEKIDEMFDNAKSISMNAVICQVRANADAYYPSKLFPFSASVTGTNGKDPEYDPLKYMVSAAHKRGLKFHAWLNPYRVTAAHTNIKKLSKNNPARKWLEDSNKSNDQNVLFTESGIYFNPASAEVRRLIVNGVNEILKNYAVDGIQFDDYFYPTTEKSFDKSSYAAYCKSNNAPLPLDEWRRTNVSVLVSDVYEAVHKKKGTVFGIAPAAAVSKDKTDANYTRHYADIYRWMSEPSYIDYIAPQLYYGYHYKNEAFRFQNLISAWSGIKRTSGVKLYIGLAPYKIDTVDAGSKEWITDKSILAREVTDLRKNKSVSGFMLYSYSYVFKDNPRHRAELAALKKVLIP